MAEILMEAKMMEDFLLFSSIQDSLDYCPMPTHVNQGYFDIHMDVPTDPDTIKSQHSGIYKHKHNPRESCHLTEEILLMRDEMVSLGDRCGPENTYIKS